MLSIMRELPFIDILAPTLLAAFLWVSTNILMISPSVIEPRMSTQVWTPACQAGLAAANANLERERQEEVAAFLAAREAENRRIQSTITPLMQLMGEDFAQAFGNPLQQGLDMMSDAQIAQQVRDQFTSQPLPTAAPDDYCACIIAELLEDRISTGLYSASFRLWVPAHIQQLNQLETTLIASNRCNPSN